MDIPPRRRFGLVECCSIYSSEIDDSQRRRWGLNILGRAFGLCDGSQLVVLPQLKFRLSRYGQICSQMESTEMQPLELFLPQPHRTSLFSFRRTKTRRINEVFHRGSSLDSAIYRSLFERPRRVPTVSRHLRSS